jgi:hypothetical protein
LRFESIACLWTVHSTECVRKIKRKPSGSREAAARINSFDPITQDATLQDFAATFGGSMQNGIISVGMAEKAKMAGSIIRIE